MSENSTFLFARPTFLEGMARIFDLGATMQIYNNSKTEAGADLKAIGHDWLSVGNDIVSAAGKYEQEK